MNTLRCALGLLRSPQAQLRFLAVVAVAGFVAFSVEAFSRRLGGGQITGRTSTTSAGCSCHGGSSTSTSLGIASATGSFVVEPGSTTTFTTTVSNSTAAAAGVGVAVKTSATGSTDAGTLAVATGSGLQLVNSEITHTGPKAMTSGTAGFSFDWTAPTTHGSYFIQAAGNAVNDDNTSNGDQWNFMTAREVKVAGITLTGPNGGASYCAGSTVTVSWSFTEITSVKVDVSTNGGTNWSTLAASVSAGASGTGSYAWSVPAAQTPGNQYRIRVSDAAVATRSDASDASFSISGSPEISSQPAAVAVCEVGRVTLSVAATGSGLTYQWRRNGTAVPGGTSATYTIQAAATADAGSYDVVVTGTCGTPVASRTAAVTVNPLPVIVETPRSQLACAGRPVTFTVGAQGTALLYQWRHLGQDIAGATAASYTVSNPSAASVGDYDVVVTSGGDCRVTTRAAILTMAAATAITSQPADRTVAPGASIELTVAAVGDSLRYQWRRDGSPIAGATAETYAIASAAVTHAGAYTVAVTSACTTLVSNSARVTVLEPGAGPLLTLSAGSIDFGAVLVGGSSVQSFSSLLQNSGDSLLRITALQIVGPNASSFGVTELTFPLDLAPGETAGATITFSPTTSGAKTATVRFLSNSHDSAQLALRGTGEVAALTAPDSVVFASTMIGGRRDTTISICNSGGVPLSVTAISVGGDAAFGVDLPTLPRLIAVGECMTLNVSFEPTSLDTAVTRLSLETNGGVQLAVTLVGTVSASSSVSLVQDIAVGAISASPNPATGEVSITMKRWDASKLTIEVVDGRGRLLRTLEATERAGSVAALWDGRTSDGTLCPSGAYRAVVRSRSGILTVPVVIVR